MALEAARKAGSHSNTGAWAKILKHANKFLFALAISISIDFRP